MKCSFHFLWPPRACSHPASAAQSSLCVHGVARPGEEPEQNPCLAPFIPIKSEQRRGRAAVLTVAASPRSSAEHTHFVGLTAVPWQPELSGSHSHQWLFTPSILEVHVLPDVAQRSCLQRTRGGSGENQDPGVWI